MTGAPVRASLRIVRRAAHAPGVMQAYDDDLTPIMEPVSRPLDQRSDFSPKNDANGLPLKLPISA